MLHHPPSPLSRGGGSCICYSWWQKAKGKTMFFNVSASTTRWLPGAPQTAARTVINTQPGCSGGSPERLPFQVSLRTERPCPLHHWGVGLVEEARDERRPLLLGDSQRGPILASHGSLEQWVRTDFPLSPRAPGPAQDRPRDFSLLYQAGHPGWHAVPRG